jgi:CheY-like chemotaxis protein
METRATGLLLCDDLIFTSRITGTARALGYLFKAARSPDALRELLVQELPSCIVVDLANPGLVIANLIGALQENGGPRPKVIAYGSHVDTATLKRAREAGCDKVLTRSQFVEELPKQLHDWMNSAPTAESAQSDS